MDGEVIRWLITGLLVPVIGGAFALVFARQKEGREDRQVLWNETNELKQHFHGHQLESEKRFAKAEALAALDEKIEKRLDRFEGKLDRVLNKMAEAAQ